MTPPDWLPSPTKINLFLHIIGRRTDGYHLLQTLFQFLDYGDRIAVETNASGEINRIDHHDYPLPDHDLCIEAAKRLRQKANRPELGAQIHLQKIIPPGTGLGAGSSNAATVLLALNRQWHINLPQPELLDLAAGLGADVPVFVHGKATWAEGIGEVMTDCDPDTGWLCVVIPEDRVPTAEVFGDPYLDRQCEPVSFDDYVSGNVVNVLEPVVCNKYPGVARALDFLGQFGEARMSGTGSAVFLTVSSERVGLDILESMPGSFTGFVARSANLSLFHRRMKGDLGMLGNSRNW